MPIYNVEKYIRNCIESICNQSYTNIQIILVDDGSTDNSGLICEEYAKVDKRIYVLHQENQGLVAARKAGLAIATGHYIGFVDGDDYIAPIFFENLFKEMITHDVDFVHAGYIEEYRQQTVVSPRRELYESKDMVEVLKYCIFPQEIEKNHITPSIWSKLFRSEFIKKCYATVPNDQSYGEDLYCLCKCIMECRGFLCIENAEYHYLVRGDSMSHNFCVRKIAKEAMLMERIMALLDEYGLLSNMKEHLENELLFRMFSICRKIELPIESLGSYRYPTPEDFLGKKIVIYGAGVVGQGYYQQLENQKNYNIVAWVDKKHCDEKDSLRITIDGLDSIKYDNIVIAVKDKSVADNIKHELLAHGISEEVIIWREPTVFSMSGVLSI